MTGLSAETKWIVGTVIAIIAGVVVPTLLGLRNPITKAELTIHKDYKPGEYFGLYVDNVSDENITISSVSFKVDDALLKLEGRAAYDALFQLFGIRDIANTSGTALVKGRIIGKNQDRIGLFVRHNYNSSIDEDMRCLVSWVEVEIHFKGQQSKTSGSAHYVPQRNLTKTECNILNIKKQIYKL